jgi:hypothetical protein
MSELTTTYHLYKGDFELPIVFVTKKDALEYAKHFRLKGYTLLKETQSGFEEYSLPIK